MAFINQGEGVSVMDLDYTYHFGYLYARSAIFKYVPFKEKKDMLDEIRWYFNMKKWRNRLLQNQNGKALQSK